MQRHGSIIRVRPEKYEDYKAYHAAVWPEVLEVLTRCHIHNYSIYHHDGWLFSYFEYTGDDYAADGERIAAAPITQKWWAINKPCQDPLSSRADGEWWVEMEEIFHYD